MKFNGIPYEVSKEVFNWQTFAIEKLNALFFKLIFEKEKFIGLI